MRPLNLIDDRVGSAGTTLPTDTYEQVRRTVDEALSELQLPVGEPDDSGAINLSPR